MRVREIQLSEREHALAESLRRAHNRETSGKESLALLRVDGINRTNFLDPYVASERSSALMNHIRSANQNNAIQFPFNEAWSADVQEAVCMFIKVGHYNVARPSKGKQAEHHSASRGYGGRHVQEAVFHVRVGEALAIWGVETGPDTAFTAFRHALAKTMESVDGFMYLVNFMLDNAWAASTSLQDAISALVYSRPHLTQYEKYEPLLQAIESHEILANGLIDYILADEELLDTPVQGFTLTYLLNRKYKLESKRMKQGMPPLSSSLPEHHDTKHEEATPVEDVNKALVRVTSSGANNLVKDVAVQREVQQPITLAETYLQHYGWGDTAFALVLGNKFEQSLQHIKTIEQFEVVVGRIYGMWQQGSQTLRDCLADWCIKNAGGITQMGLEGRVAAMTGLAGDIRRKENGQRT